MEDMTPEQIEAIKRINQALVMTGDDPENDHQEADEMLCELLELFGCGETVKLFKKVKKWYA